MARAAYGQKRTWQQLQAQMALSEKMHFIPPFLQSVASLQGSAYQGVIVKHIGGGNSLAYEYLIN